MRPLRLASCSLGLALVAGTFVAISFMAEREQAIAAHAQAQAPPEAPPWLPWPGPMGPERIMMMSAEEAQRALDVVDAARDYIGRSIDYLQWQDDQLRLQQDRLEDRLILAAPPARDRPPGGVDDPARPGGDAGDDKIPPPLTAAQINAMTKEEARIALTNVSKARRYNRDDGALQRRLKIEFDLLLERLKRNR